MLETSDFPLFPVEGVRLGVAAAGLRYPDRLDLVILELAEGSETAAVFTQNAFCAAPVTIAKQYLQQTSPRYLLINTGFANAGLGERGIEDTEVCCESLAKQTGVEKNTILPFSTGVIGEYLPVQRLVQGLPEALSNLDENGWERAARGIMTTDTHPKGASVQFLSEDKTVTISGFAKGAGMICPNMATMLAFIATDAAFESEVLQTCLKEVADQTFNAITIDGDTSTNDACVLVATGKVTDVSIEEFKEALLKVCLSLAEQLIKDGEGATKFVTVQIEQGATVEECKSVAYQIAHSPLVKTALFASDPNWGRILAAVGAAGLVDLEPQKVNVYLNDICVVSEGARASSYQEASGQAEFQKKDITVRVELGRGNAQSTVYTTDFSYDYIKINANYRS